MKCIFYGVIFVIILTALPVFTQAGFDRDTIKTSAGDLAITLVSHGTLMLEFDGKVIHIDPVSKAADYANMPKGDIILLTHHHGDHLDKAALMMIRTRKTDVILTEKCAEKVSGGIVMDDNGTKGTTVIFFIPMGRAMVIS